jgi:hypothetical protein
MSAFRAIPIHIHGALEVVAAPLLLVAPFALGFSTPVGVLSFGLGVLLIGLGLSVDDQGERGSLPLNAHAGFDYLLAAITIAAGAVAGLVADDFAATVFLVGFGSAHLALTASTRFSRPLGA